MLQFLQTGKALYVLAVVCGLGIMSKLVTGSLYKRLIKETANMALTKNKNLKTLKQKTENMALVSHGIRNAGAYIEKQIYYFRFMGMTLDTWDNLSVQAMILCFLIGGAAAFGAYWYRCDSYYIVLYGTVGILSGLVMVLTDNGANISAKRQQLADCLVDYVENSPHFCKNVEKLSDGTDKRNKVSIVSARSRFRDSGKKAESAVDESAAAGSSSTEKPLAAAAAGGRKGAGGTESTPGDRQAGRFSILPRKRETGKKEEGYAVSGGDELTRSIEYLRESLDQIAASREQLRRETGPESGKKNMSPEKEGLQRAQKELKPEDIRLLGEILQEYLT